MMEEVEEETDLDKKCKKPEVFDDGTNTFFW